MGGDESSEETNRCSMANNSKKVQGVNVLVEDKRVDGAVMTSLLWCV